MEGGRGVSKRMAEEVGEDWWKEERARVKEWRRMGEREENSG